MTTIVERSAGSRSMYQVNASLARMYSMPVVLIFPTLGPHLVRLAGPLAPVIRRTRPVCTGRRSRGHHQALFVWTSSVNSYGNQRVSYGC